MGQRKLIEDPLVAIKKRELEDRRKILDNPVKMKALQEHTWDLKRKKKDKKKKKKRKKTKGSDSDDSDADLDLKLLQRIQKMEEGGGSVDSENDFEKVNSKKRMDSESPSEERERDRRKVSSPPSRRQRSGGSPFNRQKHRKSPSRRKRSPSPYRRRHSSGSSPRRRRSPVSPPRSKKTSVAHSKWRKRSPDSPPRRRRSSSSPPRGKRTERSRRKPRSPSDSPPRIRERSPYKRKTSSSTSPPRRRSPSMSPPPMKKKAGLDLGRNYRKKSPVVDTEREKSTKKISGGAGLAPAKKAALTDAEKQAKLAEMMANATWRDEQRTRRVKNYREGLVKEEAEASKEHDKNFINRELKRAQENLTVEGRITANKYKIQRGHGDMDKNFARR